VDVGSTDINAYLKAATGGDFSAKDFRTWNATMLAALFVARTAESGTSATSRKRVISSAVKDVAVFLGNTPAVCRASYIDPRVFDRYLSGWTIGGAVGRLGDPIDIGPPSSRGPVEKAVIDLIEGERTPALEKVA
jgi:DNA topoisomerase IB